MTDQVTLFDTGEPFAQVPANFQPIVTGDWRARDYQIQCVEEIEYCFGIHPERSNHRPVQSTLVELPTGTGKTEVILELIGRHAKRFGRVMALAHTKELIKQLADRFAKRLNLHVDIEQGDMRADESYHGRNQFVVASKDSLHPQRLKRFKDFGLLVIDEAHHATAKRYQDIIRHLREHNPNLLVLGVTATPERHDKQALGQVFANSAYQMSIEKAIEQGWLVPIDCTICQVKQLDLSEVRKVAGELNKKQLSQVIEEEQVLHEIASIVEQERQRAGDLKTLLFAHSVDQAEALANVLTERYGIPTGWICGDQRRCPAEKREQVMQDFQHGKLRAICNVAVFIEGVDLPGIVDSDGNVLDAGVEQIVMAKPTLSIGRYKQMLGRGLRPIPGVVDKPGLDAEARRRAIAKSRKTKLRVVDLVDNAMNHRLVGVVDIFAGRHDALVLERARKTLQDRKTAKDIQEALEKAQEQIEREQKKQAFKAKEREKIRKVRAQAIYERFTADTFDNFGRQYHQKSLPEPATEKQMRRLKSCRPSFKGCRHLTKDEATHIILALNRGVPMHVLQKTWDRAEESRSAREMHRSRSPVQTPASPVVTPKHAKASTQPSQMDVNQLLVQASQAPMQRRESAPALADINRIFMEC